MMKLSIIIPAYNEEGTILNIIGKVESANLKLEKEIIIVDDGSSDNTTNLLKSISNKKRNRRNKGNIKFIFKNKNQGKGSAIKSGLKYAVGNVILIQDADLEYNPKDYNKLIKPIISNKADVVYGSRILNNKNKSLYFSFYLGGIFLTWLTNIFYNSALTDITTGYKVFKSSVIKNLRLENDGFGFCAEITAKILKSGMDIVEVPISYKPRSKEEGKKVSYYDGLKQAYVILKYKLHKF